MSKRLYTPVYDSSIVAYRAGTEQTVNLVLDTIKAAKEKEAVAAELRLHSGQGGSVHFPWILKDMALRPPCQDGKVLWQRHD